MAPAVSLTAQRLLERSLAMHRPRVAAIDGDRRLTYAELADRSGRLGNALVALGASAERPAVSFMPNLLEYIEFDVACTRAGITRVGVSDRLSADEVCYILEHSRAAVLITTPELRGTLDSLPESLGTVLMVGDGASGRSGETAYEDALRDADTALDAPAVDPDTPCYIMYTSGTTGRPKGAVHSHGNRVAAAINMLAAELHLSTSSVMAHAGPLTHGSGSKVLATLAQGGANLVLRKFTPAALAQAVTEHGATHSFLVPTMLQRICDAPDDVVGAIRRIQQISFGGSPIAPSLFTAAIERLGPRLTQVYGSSEAPHPITLLRPYDYDGRVADANLLRSAGRAAIGADIRIVDDQGHEVPAGMTGELLIRAPGVMTSYWHDAAATSSVFSDGWYRSGDVVRIDDTGIVTFEDRMKDLIITGGLNVYPSEVERVLAAHERVREVAVLGYPDPEWGESIIAYVVPTADGALTEEDVQQWARAHLAAYKKPRRVEFRDALPLGSSNKVLKRALRDELWDGQERKIG